MRLAGGLYVHFSSSTQEVAENAQKDVVLCLGDSFTFGLGAETGQSYPSQLGDLLEKDTSMGEPIVINMGKPGQNSWQLKNVYFDTVEEYTPRVVVVLVGLNNTWNFVGYKKRYAAENNLLRWAITSIMSSRLYKLFTLLKDRFYPMYQSERYEMRPLPADMADIVQLIEDEQYGEARSLIMHHMKMSAPQSEQYRVLGLLEYAQDNRQRALNAFVQALNLDFKNRAVMIHLSTLIWESECPDRMLSDARLQAQGNKDVLKQLLLLEAQVNEKSNIYNWLYQDISEIAWDCNRRGIDLIVQGYPSPYDNDKAADVGNILKRIARKLDIPFVDNIRIFNEQIEQDILFVKDGHCTAKGYGLIAKNVYHAIAA